MADVRDSPGISALGFMELNKQSALTVSIHLKGQSRENVGFKFSYFHENNKVPFIWL